MLPLLQFSKVLDRANHLARVAVLVVVPRNNLHLRVAVTDGADHRLRRIEERAIAHADDIAGDDLVLVVAVGLRRFLLHLRVDLLDRDFSLDDGEEERRRTRRSRDALRSADELTLELGDDETDRLRCARRVRHDVDGGGAAAAQIALTLRAIQGHLIARVGMDRRHDAALDRREVVEALRHRSEAVRRAGSRRNDLVLGLQDLVVDVEDDRRQIVAGRRRNDDLLRAGGKMRRSLFLRGIEARAFEHDVDVMLAPRNLRGIGFLVDVDLLAVDRDGILASFHLVRVFVLALRRIILQEVREHLGVREIVDGYDFIALCIKHLTKREAADTSETIDRYFYCHL